MPKLRERYRPGSWLLLIAALLLTIPLGFWKEFSAINFTVMVIFAATALLMRTGYFGALGLVISGLGISFGVWGAFYFTGIGSIAYIGVSGATGLAFLAIFAPLWRRRQAYA